MSFTEIVLILAIALVILGPDKLPGIARGLGKALREFRKATREIQTSFEVEEVRRTIKKRAETAKTSEESDEPIIDPKTGEPVESGSDDLAAKKAYLRENSPHVPSVVKKPKRPTVARTGSSVKAGAGDEEGAPDEPSIEPPGAAAVAARRDESDAQPAEPALDAYLGERGEGRAGEGSEGEAGSGDAADDTPVERTSTKRGSS